MFPGEDVLSEVLYVCSVRSVGRLPVLSPYNSVCVAIEVQVVGEAGKVGDVLGDVEALQVELRDVVVNE